MLTNTHMLHSFNFLVPLLSADVHVKVLSHLFSYKLVSIESLHLSMSLRIAPRCPTVGETTLEDTKQMYFAASCIIEFVGNNAFKKLYYYSSLNFSIPKVYSLIVLLTCQWLPVDTLVQVSQSYQPYHGRMCLCAFGTHGHWKSLLGPCRLWKPLGLSVAPHPFFWLSHSGQLCLTLGLEEH